MAATTAAAGLVTTQAKPSRANTVQFTVAPVFVVPTPVTAPATVWVVDTGAPRAVEPKIARAAAVSAPTRDPGRGCVMPCPMVRTIRQPPERVPAAIAV